jgi:hypothetical protein
MQRFALVLLGLLVCGSGSLVGQTRLGIAPAPCAAGGFGVESRYAWGLRFGVTDPVRLTHLCRLQVVPGDHAGGSVVELWRVTATNQFLLSVVVGTNADSFCLTGSTDPAVFLAAPTPPTLLLPGVYEVREQGDGITRWFFETQAHAEGPGISFLEGIAFAGSDLVIRSGSAIFGPSFMYEPLPPQPRLAVTREAGQVVLRWPQSPGQFVLQSSTTLLADPVWQDVPTAPLPDGNDWTVSLPAAGALAFYSLRLANE